jgi:hypothetical protein
VNFIGSLGAQQVTTINQYYAAVDLNSAAEGTGTTMLDNALVIWSKLAGPRGPSAPGHPRGPHRAWLATASSKETD